MSTLSKRKSEILYELIRNKLDPDKDNKIKLAGIDVDGTLRGKIISLDKFASVVKDGFGFCSVVFGWDLHDQPYVRELGVSNKANGYRDITAKIDLDTVRRIPWEDNIPFFLCTYIDPDTDKPVAPCPRGLLKTAVDKIGARGIRAMAGAEYEFHHYKVPSMAAAHAGSSGQSGMTTTTVFLEDHAADKLPRLNQGMSGYSLTRPLENKDYFYDVWDSCKAFNCDLESWHTESGPGVYEAALKYGPIDEMADKAALFKYLIKGVAQKYGITPSFMAKPSEDLPGNSGHIHISLVDAKTGANALVRDAPDTNAKWPEIQNLSDMGRTFLAGLVDGLPDVMPMLAPTINSYKRLVENYWAPVNVSWGYEHREAAIRLLGPPTTDAKASRFEVRVAGSDANPHYVMAAILALGWRGVEKKLQLSLPPLSKGESAASSQGARLPRTLETANERFMHEKSVAREVFGDAFVDHFGGTRDHEIHLWNKAVSDWEVRRYHQI